MNDYDDEPNFIMNINTSVKTTSQNKSKNNKKEKKEQYLEKKMLKNKRKRDKPNNKESSNKEGDDNNEEVSHKISQNKDNSKEKSHKINKTIVADKKEDNGELYDEVEAFYSKQDSKLQKMSKEERHSQGEKKKELQKEITNELKEIKEQTVDSHSQKDPKSTIFSAKNFDGLEINEYLKKILIKNNYVQMTKIQKVAIPVMLKHKNVVIKSETGSGKTLAYVVPLMEYLCKLNQENKIDRKDGVYAVILAPTHELCMQIEETFNKLKSACINVVYGTLMGGQKIDREKQKLRKGLNVLIATPGRLLYHLKNTQNIKFDKLKTLIFDEGDRLLEMGFEKDIKESLSIITKKFNFNKTSEGETQSDVLNSDAFKKLKIFVISATVDYKIRKLVDYLMKGFKAVGFDLKNEEEDLSAPTSLAQYYACINDEFRLINLLAFAKNHIDKKIMIFVSTCDTVNYLHNLFENIEIEKTNKNDEMNFKKADNNKKIQALHKKRRAMNKNSHQQQEEEEEYNENNDEGVEKVKLLQTKVYKLHGKMDHSQRKEIFKQFNINEPGILISTDVAARGLDFPLVDWIVHYDVNPDPKEYLNRMGRSARLDHTGNSVIFLMKNEQSILDGSLKGFKDHMKEMKSGKILLEFVNKINNELYSENKIELIAQPYKDEVDENEKFRKKYFFAIFPIQRCIKSYLFKLRENLDAARKAFKSSIRSYVTFMKFAKEVFNVNQLNLTRYARSFGLYKESTKIKIGDEEMLVDYQIEKNKTKGNKKFNNKKMQHRLIVSEFAN